jgi:bifunctional non-homologous end joining protein LigD
LADRTVVEVEGRRLELSNLGKALYPSGFTKGEVLDYYTRVAGAMLPHLEGRPVTLRRFPNGTDQGSFYAKNVPRGAPAWLETATLPGDGSRRGGGSRSTTVEYVLVPDLSSLLYVANLAALELHVPQWKVGGDGQPSPPDLLVLDLDPGEPAAVVECARVGLLLRQALRADGLVPLAKTSGSKGLQLYATVEGAPRVAAGTREYARALAERLEREHPEQVVSNMRKDLRRGKVFIDWSQNSTAKTTVAPYSLRALAEPTASTPVTWDEVEEAAAAGLAAGLRFLAPQVVERVDSLGDLFAPLCT